MSYVVTKRDLTAAGGATKREHRPAGNGKEGRWRKERKRGTVRELLIYRIATIGINFPSDLVRLRTRRLIDRSITRPLRMALDDETTTTTSSSPFAIAAISVFIV